MPSTRSGVLPRSHLRDYLSNRPVRKNPVRGQLRPGADLRAQKFLRLRLDHLARPPPSGWQWRRGPNGLNGRQIALVQRERRKPRQKLSVDWIQRRPATKLVSRERQGRCRSSPYPSNRPPTYAAEIEWFPDFRQSRPAILAGAEFLIYAPLVRAVTSLDRSPARPRARTSFILR
jgi:hypothetical protein